MDQEKVFRQKSKISGNLNQHRVQIFNFNICLEPHKWYTWSWGYVVVAGADVSELSVCLTL